jgi:hypothetical protein
LPTNVDQKKCPTHFFTWRGRWAGRGLKSIIKEGIVITNLTKKKPHPSSPLERMGGVIIIINEVPWLCHSHQNVHEVQHPHLHSLAPTMEQ